MNIERIEGITAELAEFRRKTGVRVAEWTKKSDKNEGGELIIELSAVLAEADGLSRLIDSIVDGTDEKVPIDELRERFVGLKNKVEILVGRWKALRTKGIER